MGSTLLAKSDNATVVRRFSKLRSKHVLNSIHKSCKLQNNWFQMWWTGQTSQKGALLHLPNAISPPDEHALYKESFATAPGMNSRPPVAALFLVLTKKSAAPGHWMLEEMLKMPKVIADIAQRGGNVIIIPLSWALNINDWAGNCLLAINAQYLTKTTTLRNKSP